MLHRFAHACGPKGHHRYHCSPPRFGRGGGGFGPAFGVRRPLRFLAHKLDLEDEQVSTLAKVLRALKTERAQAAVEDQRALAAFADAVEHETFDEKKAEEAVKQRVDSGSKVQKQVLAALKEIHALLKPEQRERLAYLVRTGALLL